VDQRKAVELRVGESGSLRSARIVLCLLALLQLLAADTPTTWKLISITALLLCFVLISWKIRKLAHFRLLRLQDDGMVTLVRQDGKEIPGVLEGGPWVSAWVSVLPVASFDRWPRHQLLVCRSKNRPDDYRHMMMFLRLGAVAGDTNTRLTGVIRQTASGSREKFRIKDIMRQ
jgi:hypothetical protein